MITLYNNRWIWIIDFVLAAYKEMPKDVIIIILCVAYDSARKYHVISCYVIFVIIIIRIYTYGIIFSEMTFQIVRLEKHFWP